MSQATTTTSALFRNAANRYLQYYYQQNRQKRYISCQYGQRCLLLLIQNKKNQLVITNYPCGGTNYSYHSTATRHNNENDVNEILQHHDSINLNHVHGTIPIGGKGVAIAQYAQVQRMFTSEEVYKYGQLIHDMNPLHIDSTLLATKEDQDNHVLLQQQIMKDLPLGISTKNNNDNNNDNNNPKIIVHGMLVSSLFSSIFGTLVPGCIYRNQTLFFKSPVYVNEIITGKLIIDRIRTIPTRRGGGVIVTCDTKVIKSNIKSNNYKDDDDDNNTVCVTGKADVWLPKGYEQETTTNT